MGISPYSLVPHRVPLPFPSRTTSKGRGMFEKYRQRKRERAYQAALAAWQADAAELDSIIELASAGGWSAGDAA